jgi:hypothetical protein
VPRSVFVAIALAALAPVGFAAPAYAVPDTHITSGPKGPTNDATPTFGFVSDAAGDTFECQVDGGPYAACVSPFTTGSLTDGAHVFSVRASDASPSTDDTPATRAFSVDTQAPETTITKKPAKKGTKAKLKIGFSSNEPTATFKCSVDGFAYSTCTSPLKLKVGYGKHTVLVRATDAAGNTDATPAKVKYKRLEK